MTLDELADKMKEEVQGAGKSVITFWNPHSQRFELADSMDNVPSGCTVAKQYVLTTFREKCQPLCMGNPPM